MLCIVNFAGFRTIISDYLNDSRGRLPENSMKMHYYKAHYWLTLEYYYELRRETLDERVHLRATISCTLDSEIDSLTLNHRLKRGR